MLHDHENTLSDELIQEVNERIYLEIGVPEFDKFCKLNKIDNLKNLGSNNARNGMFMMKEGKKYRELLMKEIFLFNTYNENKEYVHEGSIIKFKLGSEHDYHSASMQYFSKYTNFDESSRKVIKEAEEFKLAIKKYEVIMHWLFAVIGLLTLCLVVSLRSKYKIIYNNDFNIIVGLWITLAIVSINIKKWILSWASREYYAEYKSKEMAFTEMMDKTKEEINEFHEKIKSKV